MVLSRWTEKAKLAYSMPTAAVAWSFSELKFLSLALFSSTSVFPG
jgi:hypothetical protein